MTRVQTAFISEPEAIGYLERYGIPYPVHALARDADEAADAADRLGYPVVLKVVSPQAVHKSDVGGVLVGLNSSGEVRQGFRKIVDRVVAELPGSEIQGVLICSQAEEGLEVIVGGLHDPVFGPTVMFGLGGFFVEVLQDVAFRVAPLGSHEVQRMIQEIKGYRLLTGFRGQPPVDQDALADLIRIVGRLMMDEPDIEELDLNPVRVYRRGAIALDVRIKKRNQE
jgi:acyl-CoA synthetase (NDP forming)